MNEANALDALRQANAERQKEWNPGDGTMPPASFWACELGGEVGEALNVIKKLERERLGMVGSRATRGDLSKELADIIICVDLVALHYGIDLSLALVKKFNETSFANVLSARMSQACLVDRDQLRRIEEESEASE